MEMGEGWGWGMRGIEKGEGVDIEVGLRKGRLWGVREGGGGRVGGGRERKGGVRRVWLVRGKGEEGVVW